MNFKFLSSSGANRPGHTISKRVQGVIDYCKAMPDGELYDRARVEEELSFPWNALNNYSGHPALDEHKFISGGKLWFGNARTIAAIKKKPPQ